ncbi:4385_t:CDS:1, partial [Racocetra fulgida]
GQMIMYRTFECCLQSLQDQLDKLQAEEEGLGFRLKTVHLIK